MPPSIDELLKRAVDEGASDVHLKAGSPPVLRVDGSLRRLDGEDKLTPAETEAYAQEVLTPAAEKSLAGVGSADFAYGRRDIGRFRVTAFKQRGSTSLVLRRVLAGSKTFAQLGLPRIVEKVSSADSGLIVVTGPSGSGKTTTCASVVDWINTNRACAIVTIEDPIEVLHPDKRSAVVQREVGVDTPTMATAIRGAMRHDTDVIVISEISDRDTAEAAIGAAEAGHLVVATMRTTDPADTINRLVSMFPESAQRVVRGQLAAQVLAIVSQLLVETADSGSVLACEVLTPNERAREWILQGEDPAVLEEVMKEGGFHGMQTFDQALLKHIVDRTVEIDSVLQFARNTHEVKAKALAAGVAV